MKKYIALLFSFTLPVTQAVNTASAVLIRAEPLGSGLTGMVFSLFVLILILGGLYWLTRRFLLQRGIGGRMQSMRIISVTMLGPKEKIVVVDTREGEMLILGVTSQHISLLDKRPLDRSAS